MPNQKRNIFNKHELNRIPAIGMEFNPFRNGITKMPNQKRNILNKHELNPNPAIAMEFKPFRNGIPNHKSNRKLETAYLSQ